MIETFDDRLYIGADIKQTRSVRLLGNNSLESYRNIIWLKNQSNKRFEFLLLNAVNAFDLSSFKKNEKVSFDCWVS